MLKVVLFCGGTGSSGLVKILAKKSKTIETTLIINPFDDGKSTGKFSREIEGLPGISDFRKNIVSASPLKKATLLNTRIEDVAVGNGLIASLYALYNNFQKAIDVSSILFKVPVRILSITNDPGKLSALLENGTLLPDEASIVNFTGQDKIKELIIRGVKNINKECIEAINSADLIIYGAGTQHSSLFPTYMALADVAKLDISKVKAKKILIVNLQHESDTLGWNVEDVVAGVAQHWRSNKNDAIDAVILDCSSEFNVKNIHKCLNCSKTDDSGYKKHDGGQLLKEILNKYEELNSGHY